MGAPCASQARTVGINQIWTRGLNQFTVESPPHKYRNQLDICINVTAARLYFSLHTKTNLSNIVALVLLMIFFQELYPFRKKIKIEAKKYNIIDNLTIEKTGWLKNVHV